MIISYRTGAHEFNISNHVSNILHPRFVWFDYTYVNIPRGLAGRECDHRMSSASQMFAGNHDHRREKRDAVSKETNAWSVASKLNLIKTYKYPCSSRLKQIHTLDDFKYTSLCLSFIYSNFLLWISLYAFSFKPKIWYGKNPEALDLILLNLGINGKWDQ